MKHVIYVAFPRFGADGRPTLRLHVPDSPDGPGIQGKQLALCHAPALGEALLGATAHRIATISQFVESVDQNAKCEM